MYQIKNYTLKLLSLTLGVLGAALLFSGTDEINIGEWQSGQLPKWVILLISAILLTGAYLSSSRYRLSRMKAKLKKAYLEDPLGFEKHLREQGFSNSELHTMLSHLRE